MAMGRVFSPPRRFLFGMPDVPRTAIMAGACASALHTEGHRYSNNNLNISWEPLIKSLWPLRNLARRSWPPSSFALRAV